MNVKKLTENACIPTKGSQDAAGMDLYACPPDGGCRIPAGKTKKVGTGIAVELPPGTFGAVFARSGLATKSGLRPANCVGVIDSDYRGEIIVALHNDSNSDATINSGDRIAQLVVVPFVPVELQEVTELSETDRGSGGFGSTGVGLEDTKSEVSGQTKLSM